MIKDDFIEYFFMSPRNIDGTYDIFGTGTNTVRFLYLRTLRTGTRALSLEGFSFRYYSKIKGITSTNVGRCARKTS